MIKTQTLHHTHIMCMHVAVPVILTPENTREVLDKTWPHRAKWRQIGIQLDIDVGTLDAIEANRKTVEDCLTDLILHWLRNSDPKPTHGALTAALQCILSTTGIIIIVCIYCYCISNTLTHTFSMQTPPLTS